MVVLNIKFKTNLLYSRTALTILLNESLYLIIKILSCLGSLS